MGLRSNARQDRLLTTMLQHQSNGTLTNFRGKLVGLAHDCILSRNAASSKPGVIQFLNGGRNSAPLGCEQFAIQIGCPRKSLSRMLSSKGNPSMDNLAASFGVMCRRLGVALQVNVVGQSI